MTSSRRHAYDVRRQQTPIIDSLNQVTRHSFTEPESLFNNQEYQPHDDDDDYYY